MKIMKKPIIERVVDLESLLKIAKPNKAQMNIISYKGKDKKVCGARDFMLAEIIAEILNEGTILDWNNPNQKKWFGWLNVGSSFFGDSYYYLLGTWSSVSVRLHFKEENLFWHAVKTFPKVYKNLMTK